MSSIRPLDVGYDPVVARPCADGVVWFASAINPSPLHFPTDTTIAVSTVALPGAVACAFSARSWDAAAEPLVDLLALWILAELPDWDTNQHLIECLTMLAIYG